MPFLQLQIDLQDSGSGVKRGEEKIGGWEDWKFGWIDGGRERWRNGVME